MKIGEWELAEDDQNAANRIVSSFLNSDTKIIKGEAPSGRAGKEDMNYCLTTNIKNNVGIKLPFNKKSDPEVEFLVNQVRELLGIASFKIEKIDGFPMDDKKWRKGYVLMSDWGPEDVRINLRELDPVNIMGDEKNFLHEFAVNAAMSCFLGIWDREPRNFVWDKNMKKIISIDHESLSRKPFDWDIFFSLSKVPKKFFGEFWYDKEDLKLQFSSSFSETWYKMAINKDPILKIYLNNNFTQSKNFISQRMKKEPNFLLSNIMM